MARTPARPQGHSTGAASHTIVSKLLADMLADMTEFHASGEIPEEARSVGDLASALGISHNAALQRAQRLVEAGRWKKGYRGRLVYYWKAQ